MFLQIIRLEGTSLIHLSGIKIYDINNLEIKIPNNAKTKQSSLLKENIGNYLAAKWVIHNPNAPLKGEITKTAGTENGWWELDLGKLFEIGKIKIIKTNVGKIICMNEKKKELFTDIRDGFFNFENAPDYVINLPHTYYLGDKTVSDCINGNIYEYQSCQSSDDLSCPSTYVPKKESPIHDLITDNDPLKKWGILKKKECGTVFDQDNGTMYKLVNATEWSECNNSAKIREWKECLNPKDKNTCPPKLPYVETQDCSNGHLIWDHWSSCDSDPKNPNKSTKTRKATCLPPTNGGKPCPKVPYTETEECSNYTLTEWSEWSECKLQADGTLGIKKTRECKDGSNGGLMCTDLDSTKPLEIIKPCSDGKLSKWSEWSDCKDNSQTRTRMCIEPVNGGKPCDPNAEMTQTQECKNGQITEWSQWSKCNGAFQTRSRECIEPVGHGVKCPSVPLYDMRPCENKWSECNLEFYRTNENGEKEMCTPVNTFTVIFAMLVLLLIVIHILSKV
jgi:hypothetical protein